MNLSCLLWNFSCVHAYGTNIVHIYRQPDGVELIQQILYFCKFCILLFVVDWANSVSKYDSCSLSDDSLQNISNSYKCDKDQYKLLAIISFMCFFSFWVCACDVFISAVLSFLSLFSFVIFVVVLNE